MASVKIIKRQQTNNGKIWLRLEYYEGTSENQNGKAVAKRSYEALKLFLYSKPKNVQEKEHNKDTEILANKIRTQKEHEINKEAWGFKTKPKESVKVIEYLKNYTETHKDNYNTHSIFICLTKHLEHFINTTYKRQELTFAEIDTKFCEEFKTYFLKTALSARNKTMSAGTAHNYFQRFKVFLKYSVKNEIILKNPAESISPPKKQTEIERQILTFEQLVAVSRTECPREDIKNAFLFSCYSGLRISDIIKLKWSEVQVIEENWRVVFNQKKTKGLQYLEISQQARKFLGTEGKPENQVFPSLIYCSYTLKTLGNWVKSAGIAQKITWHSGRHTYAVLQLSFGTDIFTLSKMMGHKTIATTMIYSKMLNPQAIAAANRIPPLPTEQS